MISQDRAKAAVWRQAVSVSVATGAYGISFGAVGVASGLSIAQTCALSLLMFSGGSQFALAGVTGAGGGGVAAVLTPAFVGIRNAFYGLQMAPVLRARGLRRLAAVQLTIDESTAVGSAQLTTYPDRPQLARLGFWVTGIGVYLLWNLSTLLGAVVGSALGDPARYGFDAAAAGAFLALLWPRLRDAATIQVAAAAAATAVLALPFSAPGIPVLLAAGVAMAVASWHQTRHPAQPATQPSTGPSEGPGP
jgi:predicted branched-subunit amino acid permease